MAFDPSTATPVDPTPAPARGLDAVRNDPASRVAPAVAAPAASSFDPSTAFDPSSAQEVVSPAPRHGAAAIPSAAEEAGKPYAPPARTAPPEPSIGQKVTGGIEAALNIITSLTSGPAGAYQPKGKVGQEYATGVAGGAKTVANMPGQALGAAGGFLGGLTGAIATGQYGTQQGVQNIEQSANEGAQKLSGPISESEQGGAEAAGDVMNVFTPVVGHVGELGALHEAAAPVKRMIGDAADASAAPSPAAAKAAALAKPELEGIRAAHDAGYVLTPKAAKAGLGARVAETAAGSARLSQELASRNADNTARLARQDVGLPEDVPVTPEATANIRKEAGQDYAAVQDVGKFENDAQYDKDLDAIVAPIKAAAGDYPESKLADHPLLDTIEGLRTDDSVNTGSAIEMVKQLRSKADVAFRAGDKNLGNGYRAAAGAVDNSMDRALGRMADDSGDPTLADAVDKYRAARVRIAKSYLLDDAMDGKPGEVNANVYARALKKGAPLSGPGLQIANFAKQFGDEGLAAKKGKSGAIGPTFHDIVLGALLHAPTAAVGLLARPLTRAALGSEFAQRRMAGTKPRRLVPETPAVEPPPEPTTSPGAGGPSGGGAPPPAGPLGDLTPDWETTPGAGGGPPRGGYEPGLVPAVGEKPPMRPAPGGVDNRPRRIVTPEGPQQPGPVAPAQPLVPSAARRAGAEIPAVPGRPDLADALTTGAPAESGRTPADNAAMGEPGAIEARKRNMSPEPAPSQAEAQRLLAENPEPEVRKVLEDHLAEVQKQDRVAAQQAADNIKAAQLERTARGTVDPGIRKKLLAEADKLRGTERIPVGATKEGQPAIPDDTPKKPLPTGKVTEGEPPAEKVPAGETRELTPEEEAKWRDQFKLGDEDAQRAKDVAQALKHDAPAVEAAATQHEKSPRAFDRAISAINEKGEASANEAKPAAEGSESVPGAGPAEGAGPSVRSGEGGAPVREEPANAGHEPVPAAGADTAGKPEPEPAAAVRGPDEHTGADGVPTAGRGGVSAPGEGRQGASEQEGAGGVGQDRHGLTAQDRYLRDRDSAAGDLSGQFVDAVRESDFDPKELKPALEAWAKQAGVAADDLRAAVLDKLKNTDAKAAEIAKIKAALDPTKTPSKAPASKGKPHDTTNKPGAAGDLQRGQEAQAGEKGKEGAQEPDQNGVGASEAGERPVASRDLTVSYGKNNDSTVTFSREPWKMTVEEIEKELREQGRITGQPKGKFDPMAQWREAHSEAVEQAVKEGEQVPAESLYERPSLIRNDLTDDQADIASDAMTDTYRATKSYEQAVQTYRDWKPSDELFKAADTSEKKPFGTAGAMDRHFREQLGNKAVDALKARGLLKYGDSEAEGKRGVGAVMRQPDEPNAKPSATLYYDRLGPHNAVPVLMHELGEHFGIIRLLGADRYYAMLNDLKALKDTPEIQKVWGDVERRYVGPDSVGKIESTDHPDFLRELAARLVEAHPDLPFVRRLINEIRAFFYEHFGTTMGNRVDASLVRGLAASALRKAEKGTLPNMTGPQPKPTYKSFVPKTVRPAASPAAPAPPPLVPQKITSRSDGFPPLYQ